MGKATDELIKTHRLVEQILIHFDTLKPPFSDVRATLERAVIAHGWLQDEFLLPVLWGKPLIERQFLVGVTQEHHDLELRISAMSARYFGVMSATVTEHGGRGVVRREATLVS
jgi:hypothetical protein